LTYILPQTVCVCLSSIFIQIFLVGAARLFYF